MDRQNFILAAMSAAKTDSFSPVQIQKLFFLLDREIHEYIGGELFDFKPHDYGPFDSQVYRELEALNCMGMIEISEPSLDSYGIRTFRLTPEGYEKGEGFLLDFQDEAQDFIQAVVNWLQGSSFSQIVAGIYKNYPDMKVNSVFKEKTA